MEALKLTENMLRIYVCIYALARIVPMDIYIANFHNLPKSGTFVRFFRLCYRFVAVFCHFSVVLLVYGSLVRAVLAVGTTHIYTSMLPL